MGDGIKRLPATFSETTLLTQSLRRVEKLARQFQGPSASEMSRVEMKNTFCRLFGAVFMLYTAIFQKNNDTLPLDPIETLECNPVYSDIEDAMNGGIVCAQVIQIVNDHMTVSQVQIRREIAFMQHELKIASNVFPIGPKAVPPKKTEKEDNTAKRQSGDDGVAAPRKKPRVAKPVPPEIAAEP